MSKYYRHKDDSAIVKWLSDNPYKLDCFAGIVVKQGSLIIVGTTSSSWLKSYFEPYTPTPQELADWGETATLTDDNPNKVEVDEKDVNLRLECLKLAAKINQGTSCGSATVIFDASEIYKWLTVPQ